MPRRAPDIDIEAVAEDYRRGMTLAELSERYGPVKSRLWSLLRAHGVEMRPPGRPPGKHRTFCHDTACDLYAEGYTMREIADRLGVSLTAVWNATHHIYVEPDARRALQLARLR